MTPLLFIPLLGFLAVLQATLLPRIAILNVHPDLVLLTVVSWALLRGMGEGLAWAFVGGLWIDVLSGGPFGLSSLSLVIVAFLASLLEAGVFQEHIVLVMLAVAAAGLLHGLLYLFFLRMGHHPAATLAAVWRVVIPSALYTSLFTPIVFPAMRWLHRATGREQLEW
ncbi:MAG TPA: rod shape-determining protein MreD [Caldilineae bacterium]|nr:rod shape-determining protein MreD [Caldilineae bacterium]